MPLRTPPKLTDMRSCQVWWMSPTGLVSEKAGAECVRSAACLVRYIVIRDESGGKIRIKQDGKGTHVVHQDGDLPMQIQDLVLQRDHLVDLADVRDNGSHVPSFADGLDLLGRGLQKLGVDVYHDDVHAGRGEVFRSGETDARAVIAAGKKVSAVYREAMLW